MAGKRSADPTRALFRISLDLEVPEPQNHPSELVEGGVDFLVALAVSGDLGVPERSGLPVVGVGVSVPERTVDEYGESGTPKNEVWSTRRSFGCSRQPRSPDAHNARRRAISGAVSLVRTRDINLLRASGLHESAIHCTVWEESRLGRAPSHVARRSEGTCRSARKPRALYLPLGIKPYRAADASVVVKARQWVFVAQIAAEERNREVDEASP